MNIKKITCELATCFALLILLPISASAYYTTAQTATKLTNQAAIYTITYTFGIRDFDIYMPILASRTSREEAVKDDSVAYTIREDGKDVTENGHTASFVFSNAPMVDGMYKIDANTSETMTLLVVLTTESDTPEMDYALHVEKLPFLVDLENDKNNMQVRGLLPSELNYYTTEEIELNS